MAAVWRERLPTAETEKVLLRIARKRMMKGAKDTNETCNGEESEEALDERSLYSGRDRGEVPYGQLTQLGCEQMMKVGRELREKYKNLLFVSSNDDGNETIKGEELYCRSTNLCRTITSLRALLVGLLNNSHETPSPQLAEPLVIETRDKGSETMYPQSDGVPCKAMILRKKELYGEDFIGRKFEGYAELEATFKRVLGYEDRVSWLVSREVLLCQRIHGITYTEGISEEDIQKCSNLGGFLWGRLYQDFALNRLAIGRFVHEILRDLNAMLETSSKKKMLIYSGHDSTLVPILSALEIYDGAWPPYAAYLTLEVASSPLSKDLFIGACYLGEVVPLFHGKSRWCPLPLFIERMKEFALTPDEYSSCCADCDSNITTSKSETEALMSDV